MHAREVLLIALGGALGSVARFTLVYSTSFLPMFISILIVNVMGSFVMGGLHGVLGHKILGSSMKYLSYGLLGAFTTFSAFSLEVFRLLRAGNSKMAFFYCAGSVVLSVFALWLGFAIIQSFMVER